MMFKLNVSTKRGVVLNGVLFRPQETKQTDVLVIAITGIHGNFYSNPFYYNIGETLNANGFDFVYAQTNDAFNCMETTNVISGKEELIGSWNERFSYTEEDVDAYLRFAEAEGYKRVVLAVHSLGANKVVYYLSRNHDERIARFFPLSPANLRHMTSDVSERERRFIREMTERGDGEKPLPFPFMGWLDCCANTAFDWLYSKTLDNVTLDRNGDFSQAQKITHAGALLVGSYDTFAGGDPVEFLKNLNDHMPTAKENKLVVIPQTGRSYQMKNQETADAILKQLQEWNRVDFARRQNAVARQSA